VLQLSCCCRRIIKWGTVEVLLLRSLEEFRLELVWLVAGCGRVLPACKKATGAIGDGRVRV
jgi:hypothetical protein